MCGSSGREKVGLVVSEATRRNAGPIYQSATFIDEGIWLIFNFDGSVHSQANQNTTSIRVGIVADTRVNGINGNEEEIVLRPGRARPANMGTGTGTDTTGRM